MLTIADPSNSTEVLLIHAPYPGRLKFDAAPSSLLYAIAPLARRLAGLGELSKLGLLDPGMASPTLTAAMRQLFRLAPLRVVAISTSTAAIEETIRIVSLVREERGNEVLVLVGGPHEDDCDEKVASRVAGVDVSIAGDAGLALELLISRFLDSPELSPRTFIEGLTLASVADPSYSRVSLTSPWWGATSRLIDAGRPPAVWLVDRPIPERLARFSIFNAAETLTALVSAGCSYGRCAFCAEGGGGSRSETVGSFDELVTLCRARPGAALYFQDSIFPNTRAVRTELLPALRELGVEWGAQVYLGTLRRAWVNELAHHGCRYLYTGLESASPEVLETVGKAPLEASNVRERLGWLRDAGIAVGISLMFGALAADGSLVETEATVEETMRLAETIREDGVEVAGFYPNVETVLPGTPLARNLARVGHALDFYRPPRADVFSDLEDGSIGFNFVTLPAHAPLSVRDRLAARIADASRLLSRLNTLPRRSNS